MRYAEEIDTVHGQSITIGDEIFIADTVDLSTQAGQKHMLHELEHVQQYRRKGGVDAFLSEYLLHGAGKIVEQRSLSIHDNINMERDAIAKANNVIDRFGFLIIASNKSCSHPIRVVFRYENGVGDWSITDWYRFNANEGASMLTLDDRKHLHTRASPFYFYAETTDGSELKWSGSTNVDVGGTVYGFQDKEFDGNSGQAKLTLDCT